MLFSHLREDHRNCRFCLHHRFIIIVFLKCRDNIKLQTTYCEDPHHILSLSRTTCFFLLPHKLFFSALTLERPHSILLCNVVSYRNKYPVQIRGPLWQSKLLLSGKELLASCPIHKMEDHPLSAVRYCSFTRCPPTRGAVETGHPAK
jgi:hypothetical protein